MKIPFFFMMFLCLGIVCLAGNTKMRLGTDEWEPYEYFSENSVTGFSTEVVETVLNKIGVSSVSFTILPWARAIALLSTGEIDALFSCSRDSAWESKFYYASESIFEAKWVLFIKNDNTKMNAIYSYSDLNGKTIGIVRGHSYTREFWNYLNINKNYIEVTFDGQMYAMLNLGYIDYAAGEYVVGLHQIKKNGLLNIVALLDYPIKESFMYIMFSKKTISKHFVDEFSKELKHFKGTAEYLKLKNKYLIE
jgi:polar amino acid transport system substrate-binding protein